MRTLMAPKRPTNQLDAHVSSSRNAMHTVAFISCIPLAVYVSREAIRGIKQAEVPEAAELAFQTYTAQVIILVCLGVERDRVFQRQKQSSGV